MPYLGDYLGQLLSEISMARMQADLETVRVAELYASHPLLRTMPVPHLRLPDVDLEIPVLIKASEEPRPGESARGGATLADLRRKFDEVFGAHLTKAGISLSAAHRRKVGVALDNRLALHGLPAETGVDVHRVADDFTTHALEIVREFSPATEAAGSAAFSSLATGLKEAARLEFLKLRTPPPRLTVLVTSSEIREAGTSENITRLRLKISEQGVEWTTVESEGLKQERLVPE